jgi:eukaryotic-like serine/threonine-protein kinase
VAYAEAGRTAEAITLQEETLKLETAKLGPDDPATLTTRSNLASAYLKVGRVAEAIAMHDETLKRRMSIFGPNHAATLTSRNNLAFAFRQAGRFEDAIAMWEAILPVVTKTRGASHPIVLSTTRSLCGAYESLGRWAYAEPLRRTVLEQQRSSAPPASLERANDLNLLGTNLLKQEKWTAAEPILRESLKICAASQPDHWTTFSFRSALGDCLLGQKKFALAEPLIVDGYEGTKAREAQIPPRDKPRLTEAADRLVKLYEAWGKPEKAAEWRKRLAEAKAPAQPAAKL